MWETIHDLVRGGSTVLLTTQYMEEADRLADDIVVIDRGRVIAHGTSDQLKKQLGGERIEIVLADASDLARAERVLAEICMGDVQVDAQTRRLTAAVSGGADALRRVLGRVSEDDIEIADIGLRRPTLDDVFLTLTGHVAEEVAGDTDDQDASKSEQGDAREGAVR